MREPDACQDLATSVRQQDALVARFRQVQAKITHYQTNLGGK